MKKILITSCIFSFVFFFGQKSANYLQVGYASVCCGTPSEKPVMDYLNSFKKKNKVSSLEILKHSGLGREGEYNLYIGTDKLSVPQRTSLVKGLKAVVDAQNNSRKQDSDGLVNFNENETLSKADVSKGRNVTVYKK
ncbi:MULTISPECIES: hypothetical protein [Chryseobacterium]|uniref:HMA domain-containing protein n=1 Tax=Chryseobacterium camelliae TaxID=1265445 RepID=A0ABU0TEP5_9FLAO|nr:MULTISPECIES: hypothetical protein [Chryseobacterium]MDT3406670.1 hypothetical protein [Pseudacidovorax intermedius]MDQ1095532.1 hypothetical protein [Chryseobacterium camelliae]MDQ1099470.1 hypothetical protein [Chryseobacterium sp. SORGH_AS_1048]MDR6086815.1 hypothetical protein [Chryseobacterium sp. SORGH_AS_0909]MDR6131188.1 hypothetical protein [Chryseobacterium sp. SORGH_AS_1175]